MDAGTLADRILMRYADDEAKPDYGVVLEYVVTVQDRLMILTDATALPESAGSIVVEACMKALRLRGFEGSRYESVGDGGSVNAGFVDGILDEFSDDIARLRSSIHRGGIKFLK